MLTFFCSLNFAANFSVVGTGNIVSWKGNIGALIMRGRQTLLNEKKKNLRFVAFPCEDCEWNSSFFSCIIS